MVQAEKKEAVSCCHSGQRPGTYGGSGSAEGGAGEAASRGSGDTRT